MKKKILMIVAATMAAQMTSAQEVTTQAQAQQDSLLQMMNDSSYWKTMELGEVVVKSSMPKTRVKGDAMRTMVSGSILEKAGSATDLLNKIPTLKAEKDGGVEVFGRGAAEVYINGRKVQDMNELGRLRSEDIMHVDVVQTPGARYAASTKAVVRITMKKKQGEGLSFVDNAGGMYRYGGTATNNLDVNYRTGGLDVTASFWAGTYGHNRGTQTNDISYLIGKDYYIGHSSQRQNMHWVGYSPQIQLNYVFNENHSIGAYYKWDDNTKNRRYGWFLMENEVNGKPTENMLSDMDSDGSKHKHIFNAYYNGKVGKLAIDWNLDGLFDKEHDWSSTLENTTYVDGSPSTVSDVFSTTDDNNDFWATKLILSYPIWQGSLSAGMEYSHSSRNSIYNVLTDSPQAVPASTTDIREDVTSGFVEYGRAFGSLYAQAGLRYEYQSTKMSSLLQERKSDASWFPTLTLTYRTRSQLQLALTYRKDIERPRYDNLSSNVIYINKYSYQAGNPYLTPIYTHNISLNAAYRWANLSVVCQRIKDDIVLQTKPFPGSDDPMISLILPENSPEAYNRLMFTFNARPVIGVWHPMFTASFVMQDYKSVTLDGTMTTLNHPYAWIGCSSDFVLPHDWRINVTANLMTKGDYMTYRMVENTCNTSLGIQKDVTAQSLGKFTFDLRCYDPFNIAKSGNIIYGIRQIEAHNEARRTFSFDVTWRFNEAQKKYRGSGAGESQKKRM